MIKATRRIETDDTDHMFSQQQTIQRQQFDRSLHQTVVLDTLRKSKKDEGFSAMMIKSVFDEDKVVVGNDPEEEEETVGHKPFNPFDES